MLGSAVFKMYAPGPIIRTFILQTTVLLKSWMPVAIRNIFYFMEAMEIIDLYSDCPQQQLFSQLACLYNSVTNTRIQNEMKMSATT